MLPPVTMMNGVAVLGLRMYSKIHTACWMRE